MRAAIESALAPAIESGDATDAAISNSESQRRDFWALREAIPLARARAGKWAQIDAALPVATIADFIAAVESKFAPRCDGQIALYGHAGDGNLHIGFRPQGNRRRKIRPRRRRCATRFSKRFIVAAALSAPNTESDKPKRRCSRDAKTRRVARDGGDQRALDPRGMMNPGKVFAPELLA